MKMFTQTKVLILFVISCFLVACSGSGGGSSDAVAPTITEFTIPATSASLTIPITSFTATDNVAVSGYMITENATAPTANTAGWSATAPTTFTFSKEGTLTAYAWVKDSSGNVVSAGASRPITITTSTTLKGVITAGVFQTATVDIYAVKADGTLDTIPLKTVSIVAADNGIFTANIGTYKGAVVAVAYGTYTDEATGATITLPLANALRAALPASAITAGEVKMNITALTTVAVEKASPFSDSSIEAANTNIGKAFGVTNITTVAPATVVELAQTTVSDDQKKYTALLALLSQYTAKLSADPTKPTASEVSSSLSGLASAITGSTIKASTAYSLQTAATALTTNATPTAVVTAIKGTTAAAGYVNSMKDGSLLNGGTAITIFPLKLKTVGTGVIGSIHTAVTLPAGVTIFPSNTTGISSSITDVQFNTTAQKTLISLAKATGIGIGDFLTIYCGYPAGTSPVISDIIVSDTKITDLQGNPITSLAIVAY
jgi:hypothetical protein